MAADSNAGGGTPTPVTVGEQEVAATVGMEFAFTN